MCSAKAMMKVIIMLIGYFSLALSAFGSRDAVCASPQVSPYFVSHFDAPRNQEGPAPILQDLRLALAHTIPLRAYLATVRWLAGESARRTPFAPHFSRRISEQRMEVITASFSPSG